MPATKLDESAAARKLLERADRILKNVDEAYIISHRGHKQRLMPAFRPEEISLGKVLGSGGFGVVNEITKFTLDPEETEQQEQNAKQEDDDDMKEDQHPHRVSKVIYNAEELAQAGNHVHYDVHKARRWMEKRCLRKGEARYAIKRLHGNLSEIELARGMVDLAVEAKYLSVVWHPNISK